MKINIFAEADWYRARPEPEKVWQGVLQEQSVPVGPNTRTGLNYTLVTEREQFPVYAVNVEPQLVPFLGRQVRVHGKLVNLSNEGFGKELWISSIRCY